MNCRICFKPTEGESIHADCDRLRGAGWTDAQIIAMREGRANPEPLLMASEGPAPIPVPFTPLPKPMTFGRVVWAVILGNLVFSIACALIYFVTH